MKKWIFVVHTQCRRPDTQIVQETDKCMYCKISICCFVWPVIRAAFVKPVSTELIRRNTGINCFHFVKCVFHKWHVITPYMELFIGSVDMLALQQAASIALLRKPHLQLFLWLIFWILNDVINELIFPKQQSYHALFLAMYDQTFPEVFCHSHIHIPSLIGQVLLSPVFNVPPNANNWRCMWASFASCFEGYLFPSVLSFSL